MTDWVTRTDAGEPYDEPAGAGDRRACSPATTPPTTCRRAAARRRSSSPPASPTTCSRSTRCCASPTAPAGAARAAAVAAARRLRPPARLEQAARARPAAALDPRAGSTTTCATAAGRRAGASPPSPRPARETPSRSARCGRRASPASRAGELRLRWRRAADDRARPAATRRSARALDPAAGGGDGCVEVDAARRARRRAAYSRAVARRRGADLDRRADGERRARGRAARRAATRQIAARLWDVAPDGASQRLVARGLYRPGASARQALAAPPRRLALPARPHDQARAARQRRPLLAPLERPFEIRGRAA